MRFVLFSGCDVSVPGDFSLGGHGSAHGRVGDVCNEDGGSFVHSNYNTRSNYRVWDAQHDWSDDFLSVSVPFRHNCRFAYYFQKATKQVGETAAP